jgi:hypothetical protein
METNTDPRRAARYGPTAWLKYILIAVVFEKIAQHSIMTLALFFNVVALTVSPSRSPIRIGLPIFWNCGCSGIPR